MASINTTPAISSHGATIPKSTLLSSFGAVSPGPGAASSGSTQSETPSFNGESSLFIGQPTPAPVVFTNIGGRLLITTWKEPPAGKQMFASPGASGPNE